ncbi:hypothetical protein [Photobacterium aquimaris]|uniref:Lipoprotein n=1 Tax=Photobacterium aquimaris TaxID=512643 RepID=A0A2T3HZ81_9GAMM|nr:hypothetical protein [Photobacterium aquimaris]MCP4956733.1 hypothetical protein [Photobacterium aquimaris]OBU14654.1 hypothetical protein AYY21_06570 [Photobacterium aquimaris]PQJ41068.1 hypothetical protein BTN98_05310 [Photobacterium aquimaris]PSU06522.1 hypothetical protein C0W81_07315 [Photobacterium aquimaris]
MKPQLMIITSLCFIMLGCSSHQAKQMGIQGGSVNAYARQMSNSQLCATYLKQQPTNQTRVSLVAEWRHRKLSRAYCSEQENEWYLTKFAKWLVNEKSAEPK